MVWSINSNKLKHFNIKFNHLIIHILVIMALLKFVLFVFFVILTSQNYSQIENDVLYWLNMVRANPAILIPHIQNQLDRFNGTMIPIAPYFNYATK